MAKKTLRLKTIAEGLEQKQILSLLGKPAKNHENIKRMF